MSRTPGEFRNYPDALSEIITAAGCPYGPFRAVSRFDPRYDDGDTSLFMLDVGWDVFPVASVRLLGINAPERTTDAGKVIRDRLAEDWLKPGRPAAIVTSWDGASFGREKYGRLLAVVFVANPFGVVCLNALLADMTGVNRYMGWDTMRDVESGVLHGV